MLFPSSFDFSLPVYLVFGRGACRLAENSVYMPVQGCLRAVMTSFFIGMKYVFNTI